MHLFITGKGDFAIIENLPTLSTSQVRLSFKSSLYFQGEKENFWLLSLLHV